MSDKSYMQRADLKSSSESKMDTRERQLGFPPSAGVRTLQIGLQVTCSSPHAVAVSPSLWSNQKLLSSIRILRATDFP